MQVFMGQLQLQCALAVGERSILTQPARGELGLHRGLGVQLRVTRVHLGHELRV